MALDGPQGSQGFVHRERWKLVSVPLWMVVDMGSNIGCQLALSLSTYLYVLLYLKESTFEAGCQRATGRVVKVRQHCVASRLQCTYVHWGGTVSNWHLCFVSFVFFGYCLCEAYCCAYSSSSSERARLVSCASVVRWKAPS